MTTVSSDPRTDVPQTPQDGPPAGAKPTRRSRAVRGGRSLLAKGEPMLWLTAGGLVVSMVMIVGLLLLVLWQGLFTFWPVPLQLFTLHDGTVHMGEVTRRDTFLPSQSALEAMGEQNAARVSELLVEEDDEIHRRLVRTGNFDLTGEHFKWVADYEIQKVEEPQWALLIERIEWGRFYGTPKAFTVDEEVVATDPEKIWELYLQYHDEVRGRWRERRSLEEHDIGYQNAREEATRLEMRQAEIDYGADSPQHQQATQQYEQVAQEVETAYQKIREQIGLLNAQNAKYQLVLETAGGEEKSLSLDHIVRAVPSNRMSVGQKISTYLSRWWEFLTAEPREANSEGGVFPAIFGTVVMTLVMSLAVVPFGVLSALYLREYAKAGPVVSAVRIAINNLAGVPSIVFGVFGLGFFCYGVGKYVDGGPKNLGYLQWGLGQWFILLVGLIGLVIIGYVIWFTRLVKIKETAPLFVRIVKWKLLLGWTIAVCFMAFVLIVRVPFFNGMFEANLPNPTFGKGGVLWAAFTLALLTLPVVIVATEEALAAVPGSMREGSYACGASKWQTIRRIVLPRAMPGIMTGTILAMARGAGEVAPLMLVGAVKLAPELPVDGVFPYIHAQRSFMHLGFHIYDLGFQSQNSEAAKPMVFTTTLLLISVIAILNISAIWLRGRLRRKFVANQF